MYTDPIADYLTRIRNAQSAHHKVVEIPASNLKREITRILHEKGYILNYKVEEGKPGIIKIALKYNLKTKAPAITSIQRVSTPGHRKYTGSDALPRVMNGMGISILSTSKGVMTEKEAVKENVGGEVLCSVY